MSLIDRPIVIVGCNRSGTTLLFRNLSEHPDTWSLYIEGKALFHEYFPVHPARGDRVERAPTPGEKRTIRRELYERAHSKEIFKDRPFLRWIPRKLLQPPLNPLYKEPPLRLVEKTPSNCFRVPMLARLFPEARFVFIVRRPEAVISSLMEGWRRWSGVGPDEAWSYGKWHYLVPPGWQWLRGRPLEEICAFQWVTANRTAWRDLREHRGDDFLVVRHEQLLDRPKEEYARVLDYCDLGESPHFEALLEHLDSRVYTRGGSEPRPAKWKELNGEAVESVRPIFEPLHEKMTEQLIGVRRKWGRRREADRARRAATAAQ